MKIISAQRYINPLDELHAVTTAKNVIEVQNFLSSVTARDEMLRYAIELCEKTRSHPLVELGISPRGVSALVRMARASAVLHERNYVIPEAPPVGVPRRLRPPSGAASAGACGRRRREGRSRRHSGRDPSAVLAKR